MLKYLLGLFLISLFIGCTPTYQEALKTSNDLFKAQYVNKLDEGSTLVVAWYHYSIEKTTTGSYVYKQYHPNTGKIVDYTTYKSPYRKIMHGKAIKWYDNGNKYQECNYKDNIPNGEWINYYHEHSFPSSSGQYINGKKAGGWKNLDTLGNIRSVYTYKADTLQGPYRIFNLKGEIIEKGTYEKGELANKKDYRKGEEGENWGAHVEEMPFMKSCKNEDSKVQRDCSSTTLLKAVYKNIKYPPHAREMDIDGMAIVRFKVNKEGKIENPEILRGICDEIAAECLRIVKFIPEWQPGSQDGKPVDVYFNLPIKFKLE